MVFVLRIMYSSFLGMGKCTPPHETRAIVPRGKMWKKVSHLKCKRARTNCKLFHILIFALGRGSTSILHKPEGWTLLRELCLVICANCCCDLVKLMQIMPVN